MKKILKDTLRRGSQAEKKKKNRIGHKNAGGTGSGEDEEYLLLVELVRS